MKQMNRTLATCLPYIAIVTIAVTAWTAIASLALIWGMGFWRSFDWPDRLWQWWVYLPHASTNPALKSWLKLSAGEAGFVMVVPTIAYLVRRSPGPSLRPSLFQRVGTIIRGTTDNYGHAAWATMREVRCAFYRKSLKHGAIVVGEAYRPDLKPRLGGKAPLLFDDCTEGSGHSLLFAGSSKYKTTTAISSLLHWTGSAVVLDPSCEMGPMLQRARSAMGHQVFQLGLDTASEVGVNVLDWIDINSPSANANVDAVVTWIFGEDKPSSNDSGNDRIFRGWAKSLTSCLLSHMLWDHTILPHEKTLRRMREGIVFLGDNMEAVLNSIQHKSYSPMARDLAATLKRNSEAQETWVGIYGNATQATAFLSNPAYSELVSGDSFCTADIVNGKTTVFLQLPLKTLMSTPAIARVLLGALLNAVYEADGRTGNKVLFLLDEVAHIGPLKPLMQALTTGRKYGICIHAMYQSVSQLVKQWGTEGKQEWYDNVAWRGYAAIGDLDTAREISGTYGTYGVRTSSWGNNTGSSGKGFEAGSRSRGHSSNVSEMKRELISPAEIVADAKPDWLFLIKSGCNPMLFGRALYFRRREMLPKVDANRFANNNKGDTWLKKIVNRLR